MSNALAIGAVTATLRALLANSVTAGPDLNDTVVTAQPLDKARDGAATANQLNLFLYLISPNATWRNQDMAPGVMPGEVAVSPLPLNLFYLLSAYGRDNDVEKPFSHLLLGQAMSALYDHPLLGRNEIAAALPGNDLGDQIERVRITLQPLSIEDISKLWAGFQMQYRLSVAYEVAVVLINSQRPVRAGLPVLKRGADGRGFPAVPTVSGAWPTLSALIPARPIRIGETLHVSGVGLSGDPVTARFVTPRLAQQVDVPATARATGGYDIVMPANPVLPAGPCMFGLQLGPAASIQPTNELPLMVAPRITSKMPLSVKLKTGKASVSLTVSPAVQAGQRVALLLGSQEIDATADTTGKVTAALSNIAAGTYVLRVRVDGVDSLPYLDPDAAVPVFDPAQSIVVAAS